MLPWYNKKYRLQRDKKSAYKSGHSTKQPWFGENDIMMSIDQGDSFSYRDGSMFSSASRDNDQTNVTNCAAQQDAPWWYNNCFHVCLTCEFTKKPKKPSGKGITWANPWHYKTFAKYVLMMIRPVK
ncbi:hypothetical protein LSH36_3029g00000 [Paralvinella palmiformis]|uniref:Fibrinogen C-terminal domain-containing protein n=1 Tax=Paralvinella palmiformis TaxID=53620 RepID=A0AAD9IPZ0_9ANNE|nr:hypothetical protein LSH36_3029g00000 [Paralvinella palmiformis]